MLEKEKAKQRENESRKFADLSAYSSLSVVRIVLIIFISWYVASSIVSVISALQSLFFLLILSIFFAYLLQPLVSYITELFKARGLEKFMPRVLAIGIVYILFFSILTIAISYIAPRVTEQARIFAFNIPSYTSYIRNKVEQINTRYENYGLPKELQAEITKKINEFASDLAQTITASLGNITISFISYLPWFVLVPIFAFFFLKDATIFKIWILRSFPSGKWRARVEALLEDINQTLSAYIRAQLVSCVFIGIICTIGFYILGLNYALLLGILAGILEFIPLIGPLTIGITASLVAGITVSAETAFSVAIFLIVLRILHDYVTYPKIVRGGIHLHPIVIILSVLIGENLAGIPGVFISIPVAALITVIYKHYLEYSGQEGIFNAIFQGNEENQLEKTKS
jgi:predicted PurR-regulated permease PerM